MTDDFVGYCILNEMPGVTHVNCRAHAQRKFTEADKTAEGSPTASRMLDLIGKLYFVEKQAREASARKGVSLYDYSNGKRVSGYVF